MKKWVKILLGIILALLLIAAAVAWWQWENLRAVYIMLTTDEASIVQSLEDKRLEQDAWLSEEYSVAVTAPSAAQSNALLSVGKMRVHTHTAHYWQQYVFAI